MVWKASPMLRRIGRSENLGFGGRIVTGDIVRDAVGLGQ